MEKKFNKKIVLYIIVASLVVFGIYQVFFKKEESVLTLAEVVKGTISQEVSETGQVQKGNKINLSFKNSGRIERIYVEVGREVVTGEILAKLETAELQIQVQEAKAALSLAHAELDKLLAGASIEEIQKMETAVANVETELVEAKQNLEDVKAAAEDDLNSAYEDALNVLDDAYLKAYNAQNSVDSIQRSYFSKSDQQGIEVISSKGKIETAVSQMKFDLQTAKTDSSQENIGLALSHAEDRLAEVSEALKDIREICEDPDYRSVVSSADKTILDTDRKNINTVLTNITNSRQTISSTKLTNTSNINAADYEVSSDQGALRAANDDLALLKAPARQEDVNLNQAKVDQAKAKVQLLEAQISQSYLRSPFNGQVADVKKRDGEVIQSIDAVIGFLPSAPFEIDADIYEEDVVKIKVGNIVDISLVAFPNRVFPGRVIAVDPAERLVEGVVYYKVIVAFEEFPEEIKPGMTADIIIKTVVREDVLMVPEEAVRQKDNRTIVEVFKNEKVEEREIETGLLGGGDIFEVVSGLQEGEKVIINR
ncbi:MAG: efflux RND transporter periplasmic adaptor subunit [bacterium]